MLVFDLRAQTDCKNISLAKKFVAANEIQVSTEIIRIKHLDHPLVEIRRKKSAVFQVAIDPELASIELNLVGSNTYLIRQPNVLPMFVPILWDRQRIRLPRSVFPFPILSGRQTDPCPADPA